MLNITCLDDIAALRESSEVECKLAQGRDGKGAVPKDMWESYSAFSNTLSCGCRSAEMKFTITSAGLSSGVRTFSQIGADIGSGGADVSLRSIGILQSIEAFLLRPRSCVGSFLKR